ncbi:MAG: DUF2911 domain-containing protein [Chitinophagaceae bacterium]|nr:DUF2911 domain-containing protein [Chitinophagaceae bacterium]
MKKVFISFLLAGSGLYTQAQIKMPAASPTQTIKQNFALSSIEITYSRPGLKGRQMIGEQVPWNVVWRTGANTATTIRFNSPVEILGQKVDSGTYALYTIPEKNGEWKFILNKGIKNWGVNGYESSEDLFRIPVKANHLQKKVETLAMQFTDVKPESCVLNIQWENFSLNIPIVSKFRDQLRQQFDAAIKSDAKNKPYFQAAEFFNEYDNNKPKALELVNEAIKQANPNPPFYVVYYKAKLQQELGDVKGAIATSEYSLELSKKSNAQNYIILNNFLLEQLGKKTSN